MKANGRFVHGYLGYLLGQANHALYKDFDLHVRAAGLSSVEWRVLATLHDSEPLTVSQLAHEVLSKQPTITKLVQRMGEQGWVQLLADPADQRRTLVSVTPARSSALRRSAIAASLYSEASAATTSLISTAPFLRSSMPSPRSATRREHLKPCGMSRARETPPCGKPRGYR